MQEQSTPNPNLIVTIPKTLDARIKSELSEEKYKIYERFYNFALHVNNECTDLWSIDDDIDKRREIKIFIFTNVRDCVDINTFPSTDLFIRLCDLMINLDVTKKSVVNDYVIVNGFIAKICF